MEPPGWLGNWRRLLLACLLGGLLALSLHPGSRAFLLADLVQPSLPIRELGPLPVGQDAASTTLWFERAATTLPERDGLLSLYEAAEERSREEPGNAAWWRNMAWVQVKLGNIPQAEAAWGRSSVLRDDNDHATDAASFHMARWGSGPQAWRWSALMLTWPLSSRDKATARALQSEYHEPARPRTPVFGPVAAAALPESLLAVSLSLALLAAATEALRRVKALPRLADGWAVFGLAVVAGVAVFLGTHLTAASLWVSLLVASFGVFRDRILHHNRRIGSEDWAHYVIFVIACAFVVAGITGLSTPVHAVAPFDNRASIWHDCAQGFVQGGSLVFTLSIGLSLVRAYTSRVEPVVEVLATLSHVAARAAAVTAALTLIATPACMAWDRALTEHVAQSGPGHPI